MITIGAGKKTKILRNGTKVTVNGLPRVVQTTYDTLVRRCYLMGDNDNIILTYHPCSTMVNPVVTPNIWYSNTLGYWVMEDE